MIITGEYYNGLDTRKIPASFIFRGNGIYKVIWAEGEHSGALADARITARLGNIPRHIHFENGAQFTTQDNEGIDRVITAAGFARNPSRIHKLENNLSIALASLALLAVSVFLFFQYGVPALAERAVAIMPHDVESTVATQTIEAMDKIFFTETTLDEDKQHDIRMNFNNILREQGFEQNISLLFRNSERVGPNAFALPDGNIIVTDQLVNLAEDNEEIIAVLGHELGHIVNKHSMRRIIENSAITLVVFTITSDTNTVIQAASTFPAMLINNKYSREYEGEADRYGLDFLERAGISPEYYATILHKLDEHAGGDNTPSFLSNHPATAERIKLIEGRSGG